MSDMTEGQNKVIFLTSAIQNSFFSLAEQQKDSLLIQQRVIRSRFSCLYEKAAGLSLALQFKISCQLAIDCYSPQDAI